MRIRINKTDIIEAKSVFVESGGRPNEMKCWIYMIYGDGEYESVEGEFDCSGVTTFEECEAKAIPFIDELYEKGYIDISSEKKCKKYGLTIL